ncbi:hypothetical protein ABT186_01805 [Streptomyces sp. NPDC001634]|uniref:hypothetical protein n=1 Tax=Streptomyces sp. NPDC001634 TaxID=3154390 RepID=UPI003321308C
MTGKIYAPWTPEQVSALNRFQQRGGMHPFTCGKDHHSVRVVLMAHRDGWHCSDPECGYRQDWAHAFMADPDAWPKPFWERRGPAPEETDTTPLSARLARLAAAKEALREAEKRQRAEAAGLTRADEDEAGDAYEQAVRRVESSGPRPEPAATEATDDLPDPSWSVRCRPPGCNAQPGERCRRRDGSMSTVSHGERWREYDRQQAARPAPAATEATGTPDTITDLAYLREQYAAVIRRWWDADDGGAEEIADAVLAVRDRHLAQLRQRLELADEIHRNQLDQPQEQP